MVTIAEHTVELSLLTQESKVLDLGCRNFGWSRPMLQYVDKVCCVDADPSIKPIGDRLPFLNRAVSVTDNKTAWLKCFGNGTGNYIVPKEVKQPGAKYVPVMTATLKTISDHFRVDYWDVIKCDIEGNEIGMLMSIKEPPARQITCEFHVHTGTPEKRVLEVFDHLAQWYEPVKVDYSAKHGCGKNWWDVLWIRKDLLTGKIVQS